MTFSKSSNSTHKATTSCRTRQIHPERETCACPPLEGQSRASAVAIAVALLAAGMSQTTYAANYTAATETQLRNAITAANANGDASSTITLTGDIAMSGATAFPTSTKPLTIDTNGRTLSGFDRPVNGVPDSTAGGNVAFTGVAFINSGVLRGGAAEPAPGASVGVGGIGLQLINGALANSGTIIGGTGGNNVSGIPGNPTGGTGASLSGGAHVNNGAIRGGAGGPFLGGGGTISSTGGTGLLLNNGSLVNNGLIEGGAATGSATNGGIAVSLSGTTTLTNNGTIRGGTGPAMATSLNVRNGVLVSGQNATILNSGTIEAGSGARAVAALPFGNIGLTLVNSGTIRAGAGQEVAVSFSASAAVTSVLELHAGSVIEGNVVASLSNVNDVLRLGGTGNASFNAASIGAAAQYRDFSVFQKNGTSTWTLTGATAALTPWQIQGARCR